MISKKISEFKKVEILFVNISLFYFVCMYYISKVRKLDWRCTENAFEDVTLFTIYFIYIQKVYFTYVFVCFYIQS